MHTVAQTDFWHCNDPTIRGELGFLSKAFWFLRYKQFKNLYNCGRLPAERVFSDETILLQMQDERESNVSSTGSNSWKPLSVLRHSDLYDWYEQLNFYNWTTYTEPSQMKHESQNWAPNNYDIFKAPELWHSSARSSRCWDKIALLQLGAPNPDNTRRFTTIRMRGKRQYNSPTCNWRQKIIQADSSSIDGQKIRTTISQRWKEIVHTAFTNELRIANDNF